MKPFAHHNARSVDEAGANEAAKAALLGAKPLSMNAYKMDIAKTLVKRAILINS